MRQRPDKVDANQQDIIDALHAIEFAEVQVSRTPCGDGHPDLLVGIHVEGFRAWLITMEVKAPKSKLNPMQERWHQRWQQWPTYVVASPDAALAVVQNEIRAMRIREKSWKSSSTASASA